MTVWSLDKLGTADSEVDRFFMHFGGNKVESCRLGVVRGVRGQSRDTSDTGHQSFRESQGSWWGTGPPHLPREEVGALISSYLLAHFQIKEVLESSNEA